MIISLRPPAAVRLLVIACFVSLLSPAAFGRGSTNPPPKLVVQETPIDRTAKVPISFAPVVKRVAPGVVNIYSSVTVKERGGGNPLLNDPFFRHFFGDDFGPRSAPRERKSQSLGSGVIVSADGYVLTANHVVEGADSVKVAFASGEKEFDAKVIGTDPPTDIAVLKIEAKQDLPALPIADSERLEVGDMVLAIGNPFGVGQTVTLGIVSGLGRGGFGINGYENFIQSDAAINPGNSGGALVDVEGRLVGINTAIISGSGGSQGVGFAVPVNMARYVMDRLITHGSVARGYLGMRIQALTPDLAKEFKLPDESSGVLVSEVVANSAAAKAGMQDGDVIVQFNGKKATDPRTLQLNIAQTPPGTKVEVRVLRGDTGGKPGEKTLTAVLGTLPNKERAARQGSEDSGDGDKSSLDALDGVEVADIDAAARRQFDLPARLQGALVVKVDENSVAAKALHPGDVIVGINRQPVHSADDAVSLSEKAKGERVLLKVWSRNPDGSSGTHYVPVENSKEK